MFRDFLHYLFDYDHNLGRLIYKENRGSGRWKTKGKPAGSRDSKIGYIRVSICGKNYGLHRLVWVFHFGDIPTGMLIDHIDRDPSNNRIENLRLATYSQNLRNRALPVGQSGHRGVFKKFNRWYAVIWENNKTVSLGSFQTAKEAVAARKAAELRYGFYPS